MNVSGAYAATSLAPLVMRVVRRTPRFGMQNKVLFSQNEDEISSIQMHSNDFHAISFSNLVETVQSTNIRRYQMNNVLVLPLLTMVIMGFVGGLANGLRIEKEKKLCQPEFYQKLLVGIIGGVSVPLILQLISSNVLDWVGKTDFDYQKYLVFLAYCAG